MRHNPSIQLLLCIFIKHMGNTKEIDIKNRTSYFFDDMIIMKDFGSTLLKIDEKS